MKNLKKFATTTLVICIAFINMFATPNNSFSLTADGQNNVIINFGEVSTRAIINVKILNTDGAYVYNDKIVNEVKERKYDLKHLPTGAYTVKVEIGNTIKYQNIYKSEDKLTTDISTLTTTFKPSLKSTEGKVDVTLLCNKGKFEIRIVDENGNNVHEETHDAQGSFNNRYNLNELPNGSYRFIVEMDDEMHGEESFDETVIIAED